MSRAPHLPPARRAALETVRRAEHPSADLQAVLDSVLANADLSRSDTALATELAYGYFRFRDRLHFILDHFFAKPKGITDAVRQALSLAAYELLLLDRVPDYAAVDWAVEHVKAVKPSLTGVANAVLRNVARLGSGSLDEDFYAQKGAQTDARRDEGRLERWSRFYSCPHWIVQLWDEAHGPETTLDLLRAGIARPPLGVRVNAAAYDYPALLDSLCSRGRTVMRLHTGAAVEDVPLEWLETLELQGRITRQSAAGQQAMEALDAASWPGPVWDACAGRGGKTGWLAEHHPQGTLWASDSHMGRLKGLKREMARINQRVPAFRARAQDAAPLRSAPRTIFLDAPCSGLGVLSRRPDSRYKRTPEDLAYLSTLQASMLDSAVHTLAPGGLLAYLTCTVNPAENEERIQALLALRPDLILESRFSTDADSPLREFFFGSVLRKA